MNHNRLFKKTRLSLTLWYVGIFSTIAIVCGLGVYEIIFQAQKIVIDNELKTVAGTFHDSLETVLEKPGKIESSVTDFLPDLCSVQTNCSINLDEERHLLGAIQQEKYYFHFFNLKEDLVARAGIKAQGLAIEMNNKKWQNIRDNNGIRYRQISLILHTKDNRDWGYFQVGRSLSDFDSYINNIKWLLFLGLPALIILVIISSWYLALNAMQPLYQSYDQIQQFTADAAHELRTPLAAIRATIESTIMQSTFTEKESRETLKTILRQNQRLSNLVADLLILCRMNRDLAITQVRKEVVDLSELIHDTACEFSALALAKSINLTTEIKVDSPFLVRGNEEQLYRLVANLVVNAIQNTLFDGEITLILEEYKKQALIKVVDTGIGISQKEQKLIFNRFYRVNKARSNHKQGAGLGLSIVKAIVQTHQGSIQVQSELDKGSIFIVMLPKIDRS